MVERSLIGRQTMRLVPDLTIPVHAQGIQLLKNQVGGTRGHPWRVEVFDANPPDATMRPGIEKAGHSRHGGARMKRSAGAGSKTTNIRQSER